MKDNRKIELLITIAIIVFFALIFLFSTFYTIASDQVGVLTTFAKVANTPIYAGLHMKIPFIQNIIKYDTKTLKYAAEASASSKDLQIVTTTVATNYHILPAKAPTIHINLGVAYSDVIIQPLEQETVKSITAKYNAVELITNREEVRLAIRDLLASKLKERDIIVDEVSITNFKFSDQFDAAIEQKVTAEQNALKEQNNLQVVKFQAQQAIEKAKGEASAIEIINQQLQRSPQYINYMIAQKWNGVMPLALGSGNLLSIVPQQTQTQQQVLPVYNTSVI